MEYTEINEQYIELLYDYFDNFKKSSIHKNVIELTKYFYIGIHSYNRVFNYVLFKTNSLDKAIFYSKKSYVFYLEYIDQMSSSQLLNDFNTQDVILFIYKNTIYKLYDDDEEEDTMTNLVTNNKRIDDIDKYQKQIEEIYNIIHLFCYWNNTQYTYHQRIELCKKNLKKILKYNNLKLITMIIEKIQQTHSFISYDNYQLLLKELIDKYDKINTKITDNKAFILQKFHIDDDVFKHKLKNVRDFVKWIYI